MIEYIIIPTLGRVNNQVTYNNIPTKWKSITRLIVQPHEYEAIVNIYGKDNIVVLPENIKGIASTRQWILDNYRHTRHFVIDDDIHFKIKEPIENKDDSLQKWHGRFFTEQDFDDYFELINTWMDEGIVFGGMLTSLIIPDVKNYPYMDNTRIMGNIFFDGPKLPKDLKYNRLETGEDLDVLLQLLSQGYKNRASCKYVAYCSITNSKGGCSSFRTLEVLNQNQYKLYDLWPDFVKIKTKIATSGTFKGKELVSVEIRSKKAYKFGIDNKNNTKLF